MSRFDHPAYGKKGEPMERLPETFTEIISIENHHYFEVRLVVAIPNYHCGHTPSALDIVMEGITDNEDLLILEYRENPVHLVTVTEVAL